LLSVFAGFGTDRFYLGYRLSAIVKLLLNASVVFVAPIALIALNSGLLFVVVFVLAMIFNVSDTAREAFGYLRGKDGHVLEGYTQYSAKIKIFAVLYLFVTVPAKFLLLIQ
jgi:TM2 domain-containing membrane protein YozV